MDQLGANCIQPLDVEETSRAAATLMSRVVAPRHGLVTTLSENRDCEVAPGLCVSWASTPHSSRLNGEPAGARQPVYGSGIGLTRDESILSCIGELLERYAASDEAFHDVRRCPARDLDAPFLDPRELIGFSPAQFESQTIPFQAYHDEMILSWIAGTRLGDGSRVFVPAQAVLLDPPKDGEPALVQPTSAGLACGPSTTFVISAGLYEVVERDAFAGRWLLRLPGRRVPSWEIDAALPPRLRALVARAPYELRVTDISTDIGLPVFAASLRIDGDALQGIVFGAAANADVGRAMTKSVLEAFHTLCWAVEAVKRRDVMAMRRADIRDYLDHSAYYLETSRAEAIDWFAAGTANDASSHRTSIRPSRPDQTLLAKGYDPIFVDLTTRDVAELGLHVGRVLVPGLHPLHAGYGFEARDRRRLESLLQWLGMAADTPINTEPHPFP